LLTRHVGLFVSVCACAYVVVNAVVHCKKPIQNYHKSHKHLTHWC